MSLIWGIMIFIGIFTGHNKKYSYDTARKAGPPLSLEQWHDKLRTDINARYPISFEFIDSDKRITLKFNNVEDSYAAGEKTNYVQWVLVKRPLHWLTGYDIYYVSRTTTT